MLVGLLLLLIGLPIGLPLLLIWVSIRLLPHMQQITNKQKKLD